MERDKANDAGASSNFQEIFLQAGLVKLVGMPLHPIPDDEIELEVREISRPYVGPACTLPANVKAILGWQKAKITEMVHWGTSHFEHFDIELGEGETEYLARCRKVWAEINDYRPRGVVVGEHRRLALKEQSNSDVQSTVTQIMGVCMGVLLAARIFNVSISAISKRNFGGSTRHDYDIQLPENAVLLEVRGRFNREARLAAIHEVDEKFGRELIKSEIAGKNKVTGVKGTGDYSQRIGIIAYPSDDAHREYPDIEIMDPEAPSRSSNDGERARRILSHYRALLVRQNLRVVEELDRLIGLSDDRLEAELRSGVSQFTDANNYLPGRNILFFGRTRIRVGGEEFLGTYFDGAVSPTWIQSNLVPNREGIFFWGVARSVFERLGSLRILELLATPPGSQSGIAPNGSVLVLLDDGVLTAWSPTIDSLRQDLKEINSGGTRAESTAKGVSNAKIGRSPSEAFVEDESASMLRVSGFTEMRGAEVVSAETHWASNSVILSRHAHRAIEKLNSYLPDSAIDAVVASISRPPHPTLIQNNLHFHHLLTDGVPVEYKDPKTGETRGGRARVIDFDNPANNEFLVVRQLTIQGPSGKTIRPDLILYVNGLPLVVIELKDPANAAADLNMAIDQFGRYKETAPDLFVPNLLLVASDGLLTRVGSITSGRQRFTPWRPATGGEPTLEALIRELLNPAALLDYLRSCVAFEEDGRGNVVKKIAGYHQFRAVRKARAQVIAAQSIPPTDVKHNGKPGGVVWHTQGSGKSLTMLMLGGTLVRAAEMANPTIVVVTDRNDLDDQLFNTFAMGRDLLRQEPVQAEDRKHLKKLLDRASGGVVFTTIHKFTESHGKISERANIVVMADEAHRSQYGFVDGGARWMRDALPNATFVGFTGTPLMAGDRVTRHVFGEYADVYDIRQAVADGATVPIYYEPRIVKLTIDEAGAKEAERKIAEAAAADENGQEAANNVRVPIEALYGAPERLERVAAFVVEHWDKRRSAMEGKAMLVTMSRDIAARLYEKIRKLRPQWHDADDDKGVMKVIMTGGPEDEPHVAQHVRSKAQRKALADRFKDPADDFRLAIIVDMWLTGFDVPSAHTMYLDKPLAGHNLMQAIARVNRVYGEKPGGLIVDLIGLADPLADALATYAKATGETDKPIKELQDEAIPAMQSAFEQLKSFFHGFNYAAALDAEPLRVLGLYAWAVDHVLDVKQMVGEETGWQRFRGMVKRLSTAFALAVPRAETEPIAPHLAFFQRVAAMIRKRLADDRDPRDRNGHGSGSSDVDAAVRQVIGGAVDAGEVIDLFAAAGLDAARLDILSDEFLQRVSALEQKNLALETLRKLLTDQIKISERTNLVQSRQFREALEKAMLGYTNKQITTAEMIAQLLELAKWVREAKGRGQELGLSTEETAFYDALAENGSAKEVMQSDRLRLMARELAEMVKKMPKLDWTQRESVRADLRRSVRRLLARYGYPPDLSEDATQLVLKQAELSTGNA